ncbi:MAG: type II toxin-antitoxin system HicB family antitoxin [Chloroflexi bacterium]|nr:type II toxin-antitoxin system HicB family antitoxin [Chloroflexota bacterium]
MAKQKFTVILIPDTSGYQAIVPHYPECTTGGDTPEEAFASAKEALELIMEAEVELEEPVPPNVHASHVISGEVELDLPEFMLEEVRGWEQEKSKGAAPANR